MNSDALESIYYVNCRENHLQGPLSRNLQQISNVLKNLKIVAIAKWRETKIFVHCVIHKGTLEAGYPFDNGVLATETFFQRKSSSDDVFYNITHEPMLQEALKWKVGTVA